MGKKKKYGEHRGRGVSSSHYTKTYRAIMEEPAWRALSVCAQALYPWLKLEWRGDAQNNNGDISFSYRQAAEKMGVKSLDTIAKAFKDLQAKGFLVVTEIAHLGTYGHGRSFRYELTELPLRNSKERVGRRLFKEWREGKDFKVVKARANNPTGKSKSLPKNWDWLS